MKPVLLSNKNQGEIQEVIEIPKLVVSKIIGISFLFLISSSFLYPSISNPLIGVVFGLPLIIYISKTLLQRFDTFSFLLIIFICNHFRFYENLWNLIFLGIFLIFNFAELLNRKRRSKIFIFLFIVVFFLNLFGLILNNSGPLKEILIGFGTFSSYLLIFYLLINYRFDNYDLKRLFKVVAFIIFFQLFVSIFQKLGISGISLPYLPLHFTYDGLISLSESRVVGTFGDFELLAEYAAFMLIFFMVLLLYKYIDYIVSRKTLVVLILSLLILVLLTGTRSSFFLIAFSFLVLFLIRLKLLLSLRLWLFVAVIFLGFNLIIKLGDPLGLQMVFDRISTMEMNANQSSAEVINREVTFDYAYKRLSEQSWIIGNGYTTGESYKKSLFGNENAIVGNYHSLYLSMPIFFGWIGSFFFVLLIISSQLLYIKNLLKAPKNSFAFYVSLGLCLTWLCLFINEFKIEFIRFPNHFFLIWFWMAISLNISNKIQYENNYAR